MNLAAVMNQVGDRLDTIAGLNVYRYPTEAVSPPAAVVAFPEMLDYDQTYGRGSDQLTLNVLVAVGRPTARVSWSRLAAYCDGTGPKSIKATVEAPPAYAAFHEVRVASAEFDVVPFAGTDYLAALFTLAIFGGGS